MRIQTTPVVFTAEEKEWVKSAIEGRVTFLDREFATKGTDYDYRNYSIAKKQSQPFLRALHACKTVVDFVKETSTNTHDMYNIDNWLTHKKHKEGKAELKIWKAIDEKLDLARASFRSSISNENIAKLVELTKINPDLEVIPMVLQEDDGYGEYWVKSWCNEVSIGEVYEKGCNAWQRGETDVGEVLDEVYGVNQWHHMTDEEAQEAYDNLPWEKAIIVYLG